MDQICKLNTQIGTRHNKCMQKSAGMLKWVDVILLFDVKQRKQENGNEESRIIRRNCGVTK